MEMSEPQPQPQPVPLVEVSPWDAPSAADSAAQAPGAGPQAPTQAPPRAHPRAKELTLRCSWQDLRSGEAIDTMESIISSSSPGLGPHQVEVKVPDTVSPGGASPLAALP